MPEFLMPVFLPTAMRDAFTRSRVSVDVLNMPPLVRTVMKTLKTRKGIIVRKRMWAVIRGGDQ